MLECSSIDDCFRALAEPARRAIVERLSDGPTNVSELARPFDLTLAAVVQHVQVLEKCGLITSEKIGRTRVCRIDPRGFELVSSWIEHRRSLVERQLDRLGEFLASEAAREAEPSSPTERKLR
jgi:DNA-binding transcriptional ArsR family regulator